MNSSNTILIVILFLECIKQLKIWSPQQCFIYHNIYLIYMKVKYFKEYYNLMNFGVQIFSYLSFRN